MMTPHIRTAVHEDLPALARLLDRLPLTTSDQTASGPTLQAQRVWPQILTQQGRSVLVAEQAEVLIGTLDLLIVPNLTHDAAPWAIVENMLVASDHRRRGVGRALMAEAIRRAQAAGCYKVQLLSNRQRRQAHEFYRSLGFAPAAEGFRLYLDQGYVTEPL